MLPIRRIPDAAESLRCLRAGGVEVRSILDIGVLQGTPVLMRVFPDLPHHLFEPLDTHLELIGRNYAGLDYHLHRLALSDHDGEAWQLGYSLDGSGRVTHSELSPTPRDLVVTSLQNAPGLDAPGTKSALVRCIPVRMARLDSLIDSLDAPAPYLVKIDVDGHELPIIQGAAKTLQGASVVMVEATLHSLADRLQALGALGFSLFDIVDLSYYGGTLWQVDLVLVRTTILVGNPILRPRMTGPFQPASWYPYPSGPSQFFEPRVHRFDVN